MTVVTQGYGAGSALTTQGYGTSLQLFVTIQTLYTVTAALLEEKQTTYSVDISLLNTISDTYNVDVGIMYGRYTPYNTNIILKKTTINDYAASAYLWGRSIRYNSSVGIKAYDLKIPYQVTSAIYNVQEILTQHQIDIIIQRIVEEQYSADVGLKYFDYPIEYKVTLALSKDGLVISPDELWFYVTAFRNRFRTTAKR